MTEEYNDDDYTCGEYEEMDLSAIRGKTFIVAISTGPRSEGKFICDSICGPFDFFEMVETVGTVYESQQLHAKAIIPGSEFGEAPLVLNENTIDFIEARYQDIVADGLLDGSVMQAKKYTCAAGFVKTKEEEAMDEKADVQ